MYVNIVMGKFDNMQYKLDNFNSEMETVIKKSNKNSGNDEHNSRDKEWLQLK